LKLSLSSLSPQKVLNNSVENVVVERENKQKQKIPGSLPSPRATFKKIV
jgi:hypothetical protein